MAGLRIFYGFLRPFEWRGSYAETVTNHLTPQAEYDVKARRISGTHDEKLDQIDEAIQELLEIKVLECAADRPNVRFLAVPRPRSHALALTVLLVGLLVALVLLLGVHPVHAQAPTGAVVPSTWRAGGTLDVSFLD